MRKLALAVPSGHSPTGEPATGRPAIMFTDRPLVLSPETRVLNPQS